MRKALRVSLVLFAFAFVCAASAEQIFAAPRAATVSGSVHDSRGNPIAGAIVSLLKDGANEIIKQVKSAADGTFMTTIAPGRYALRAIADGFSAVMFDSVQVYPADQVVYRFNLEPIGSGQTAPERRKDRDDRRWILRARNGSRSIFQVGEGKDETIEAALAAEAAADNKAPDSTLDETVTQTASAKDETNSAARTQGVVETYAGTSSAEDGYGFAGLNFAFVQPVNERVDLLIAGQTGVGRNAPQRLSTTASIRATAQHNIKLSAMGGVLNAFTPSNKTKNKSLGQLSLRAVDEWLVRDGVVVVLGLDYSRFLGASDAHSLNPRLGAQFDAGPRTRLRAAYTTANNWTSAAAQSSAVDFEGTTVTFEQPESTPIAFVDGRAVMERSSRLEFGVERVLDNDSSIEATAFFDTTENRGVGLLSAPLSAFSSDAGAPLNKVARQDGAARGLRLVYTRRMSRIFSASAGYSVGRGQQLSIKGLTNPSAFFDNGFFQTAAFEMSASLDSGTKIRTIFRFSPRATVFAIDPFAGRLAVYDPSLSILITQELPTFGLPVRAQAVIDARNLLDKQTCVDDGETFMSLDAARRSLRGGISVRF